MNAVAPKPIHPQLVRASIRERRSYAMVWRQQRRWGNTAEARECLAYCRELTEGINLLRGCEPKRQLELL